MLSVSCDVPHRTVPHNHGILTNIPPSGGFDKVYRSGFEDHTIAKKLKGSGYRTALFGKYFNGYCRKDGNCTDPTYVPPGWTDWYAWSGGSTLNVNGQLKKWKPDDPNFIEDKIIGNRAEGFIARNSGNTPMYLHVMPDGPHEHTNPDPKYGEMYRDVHVDTTNPAFNEQDVSDKPPHIKNLPKLTREDISKLNKYNRYRIRLLRTMDDMVYDIIQKLTQEGELSNSYVIFTSDNGYHMGEHRIAYKKRHIYEESIEMPLVIRGPGVKPGSSTERIVANNDFAPTFAQFAGRSWASDGHSILSLLKGQPYDARERLLIEDAGMGYKALRTARWTYAKHDSGAIELYDMRSDPWQLENIYDTANPTLKQDLAAKLKALKSCAGAECRRAENDT
jgi:N-acetylglucosamine-6-sulfatase